MKKFLFLIFLLPTLLLAQDNYNYIYLRNFSGGLNTVDFIGDLDDGELTNAQNLIYVNKNLQARKGYFLMDSTGFPDSLVKGITRVYYKNGTKKVYAACGGSIWQSNTGETDFTRLVGTINLSNYVEYQFWRDTARFVDGGQFGKIAGDTIKNAWYVDAGNLSMFVASAVDSTDSLKQFKSIDDAQIKSKNNIGDYNVIHANVGNLATFISDNDTARYLVHFNLAGFKFGDSLTRDSIVSAQCSIYVSFPHFASGLSQETLFVKRVSSDWIATTVKWTNKPTIADSVGFVAITGTGWYAFNVKTWVDNVTQNIWKNQGLYIVNKIEGTKNRFTTFAGRREGVNFTGKDIRLFIKYKKRDVIAEPYLYALRDTLQDGIWTSNQWLNYFIEFPNDASTVNFTRLITRMVDDSLYFTPPIRGGTTLKTAKKTYNIIAVPTAIEKVDTGHVDSFTVQVAIDSTYRVWIGNKASLSANFYKAGKYFLRITGGSGVTNFNDFYILDNNEADTGALKRDYLISFFPSAVVLDTSTRWEIYQRVSPRPKHFTTNQSRFWFSDTLHFGRVWYSEVEKPGAVGALNFHTLGGDPTEGEITYLGGLYVGSFADPQEPLVAGRKRSISLLFGSPITDFFKKVVSNIGIASAQSVSRWAGIMYFADANARWQAFDGQNVQWINRKVATGSGMSEDFATALSPQQASFIDAQNRIMFTNVPGKDTSYAFHLEDGRWTGKHTFGFSVASYQDLSKDTLAPIVMGDYQTDHTKGKIWLWGEGLRDKRPVVYDSGGTVPTLVMQTKWFNLGHPEIEKQILEYQLDGKFEAYNLDILFYASDSLYPTTSNDSNRIALISGNKSFHRYLQGKTLGRHFSIKLKAQAGDDFKLSGIGLGMRNYPYMLKGN